MFSARVMKLAAAVAISVVCLTGSGVQPVDATGRVLRSNCPDYDGSASASVSTSASASSAAEASASDSSDVTIDTPEPTTATPEPTTATPEPTTATPEPTTATPTPAPTAISVDVTLYTTTTYSGDSFSLTLTELNHCYVLDCFNNLAKSATWTAANFYRIGFYNNADCTTTGGAGAFPESYLAIASLTSYLPSSIKLLESQALATTVSGTSSTCPIAAVP